MMPNRETTGERTRREAAAKAADAERIRARNEIDARTLSVRGDGIRIDDAWRARDAARARTQKAHEREEERLELRRNGGEQAAINVAVVDRLQPRLAERETELAAKDHVATNDEAEAAEAERQVAVHEQSVPAAFAAEHEAFIARVAPPVDPDALTADLERRRRYAVAARERAAKSRAAVQPVRAARDELKAQIAQAQHDARENAWMAIARPLVDRLLADARASMALLAEGDRALARRRFLRAIEQGL